MPPKTNTKGKGKNQKKDNGPNEDMPKAQGDKTEDGVVDAPGKSPAVVAKHSAPEKTKDELWDEYLRLQKELESVQRQKKHFHIETNKAQRFCENSKRNLEVAKGRMRETLKLKQEAKKQHQAEIEEQELKLKQLKTAQQNELSELKMAASATASTIHEELREPEVELQMKKHCLQLDQKEKGSRARVNIRMLQQKQQDELAGLYMSFEKQVKEVDAQYLNKRYSMVKENEKRTKAEITETREEMERRTTNTVLDHETAWLFFDNVNKNILDAQDLPKKKTLENELEALKMRQDNLTRKLAAAVEKRGRLTGTLQEMEEKLSENRQQLAAQRKAMAKSWKKTKKKSARVLEERRDLYLKHHQLELRHEQIQNKFDEMQKRQTEAILNIQQRGSLKSMFAEDKIRAMTETFEKEQLKLWVALTVGQGDQTALKNIKELFQSKDAIIKDLENNLLGDLKEAEDMGISTEKWLPICNMDKAPVGPMNIADLTQKMMSLSISEDKPDQTLGPSHDAASPDREQLQHPGASSCPQTSNGEPSSVLHP
ncbi:dynein regulatory complex subunit 4-like isoform X2 [Mugil cephalus]|uniref:dynein regulatory complex subunit 4-like isoform X2 n=1 Tax=Mugil cephalus TaxID=48193 RepID=UPI001FB5CEF6|nr:dynein regulatory complex subunit 4-like isoform X2 [Mugil cephalus]